MCVKVCVRVDHLNRCKTSYLQGITGVPGGSVINEDTPRDLCKRTCGTVVVHLGAFKSQLVATYIYIYIIFIFLLGLTGLSLHVRCIPHQQFDKTFLSKCVTHAGSVKVV